MVRRRCVRPGEDGEDDHNDSCLQANRGAPRPQHRTSRMAVPMQACSVPEAVDVPLFCSWRPRLGRRRCRGGRQRPARHPALSWQRSRPPARPGRIGGVIKCGDRDEARVHPARTVRSPTERVRPLSILAWSMMALAPLLRKLLARARAFIPRMRLRQKSSGCPLKHRGSGGRERAGGGAKCCIDRTAPSDQRSRPIKTSRGAKRSKHIEDPFALLGVLLTHGFTSCLLRDSAGLVRPVRLSFVH